MGKRRAIKGSLFSFALTSFFYKFTGKGGRSVEGRASWKGDKGLGTRMLMGRERTTAWCSVAGVGEAAEVCQRCLITDDKRQVEQ